MSSHQKTILKNAEQLGFTFDGVDGKGHLRLRHEAGVRYSMAATPGDRRGYKNALAALERLAGEKLPRQQSGKYRHRRQAQLCTQLTPTEAQRSRQIDELLAEADSLQRRFAELAATPSRDAAIEARQVLTRHEQLRRLLAQSHRIIEPLR